MENNLTALFWERFLASAAAKELIDPKLYDTMQIGSNAEEADQGAALILSGQKTATSSHPDEYGADAGLPYVGALSIVLNGSRQPVAVVETTELETRSIDALDPQFAHDYGEWDQSAATLKSQLTAYYRRMLEADEREDFSGLELLCERFRVIFRED